MGPGRHAIELPKEDIILGYNEGASLGELAVKYGVGAVTIWRRLHEWEVQVRHVGPIPKRDRHRYVRFDTGNSAIDTPRLQILELETKIAAGDLNLKREYDRKQAYEKELATLKGLPARLSR